MEDFLAALKSPEWEAEIPPNKRHILLIRAKESRVQAVTFQDFVNVVSECMQISIKHYIVRKYSCLFKIITRFPKEEQNCLVIL